MTISDGQLRDISYLVRSSYLAQDDEESALLSSGRKAYELLRPLILAEALAKPTSQEITNAWVVSDGEPGNSMVRIFSNRLAALTKEKDPAVEAVTKQLLRRGVSEGHTYAQFAAEIVAAVDKARGKP
jgi:hypothetical protein